jgi:hypothetical protein
MVNSEEIEGDGACPLPSRLSEDRAGSVAGLSRATKDMVGRTAVTIVEAAAPPRLKNNRASRSCG